MEVWGGIECTINRIGDEYKDQLNYSGHYHRSKDIDVIADLGIKSIRYPILWEKHQPAKNTTIDWRWADHQLQLIRDNGIKPIAGLLHHGSGPSFTNLLDPEFPYLLAAYAFEVASRFPWLEEYTPVNEPLTTARFSGLYGLWYPHHRDECAFYKMLLNQLKGVVLSMEAIRSVNPLAELVQTEDLGKTHSTRLLSYQAKFENDRRLLTFDILCGRLVPTHPQYSHIRSCGIDEEQLRFFQRHPCRPDVMGLNYYITSERWLDESLDKYQHQTHGGNGIHRYADTEVVRAHPESRDGFKMLATEIWNRYGIPMAVTEVHLHCTREEQLRWFKEIWDQASALDREGIQIKGVTAWALLGSFDWDTLLTKTGTQYESGVFDIKAIPGQLRLTALATLIKNLNDQEPRLHPVVSSLGWWRNEESFPGEDIQPILILQGGDDIGVDAANANNVSEALVVACKQRRIPALLVKDIHDIHLNLINPWAIINLGRAIIPINEIGRQRLYVTFNSAEETRHCLKILVEQMPMNIHQINKVLDLMIDGDQGSWVFGVGNVIYKTTSNTKTMA